MRCADREVGDMSKLINEALIFAADRFPSPHERGIVLN